MQLLSIFCSVHISLDALSLFPLLHLGRVFIWSFSASLCCQALWDLPEASTTDIVKQISDQLASLMPTCEILWLDQNLRTFQTEHNLDIPLATIAEY